MWLQMQRVSWYLYPRVVNLPQEWMNLQIQLDSLLSLCLSAINPNLPIEDVLLPKCMAVSTNGARTIGVEHLF